MASNYTKHQLLELLPVTTNKEYDDHLLNKKYFALWYEVHSKEHKNGRTSKLKRFFTFSKDE
jgi:hypothetical protein